MMGGHIKVTSRLGEGSEFILSIPLLAVAPVNEIDTPVLQTGKQHLKGVSVLAAEDVLMIIRENVDDASEDGSN